MDNQERTSISRYWELDTLRGVAILWMAAFHLAWDLTFYGLVSADMGRGPWPWFSRIIATTFLILAGISLVISQARATQSGGEDGRRAGWARYLLRGGRIFAFGLLITLITYLFIGREFVVFGILHLIGFSIAAAYPLLPYHRRWASLLIGIFVMGIGAFLNRQSAAGPWWIWLGVNELGRGMVDWYPVLPWFGVMLVGIWLGHTLYPGGVRRFALPEWSHKPLIRELAFLGRHALLIYLLHQPLLLGIVYAISWLASRA